MKNPVLRCCRCRCLADIIFALPDCEYAAHCGANIISRPEGFGWHDSDFGGNFWYVDDDQLLEVRLQKIVEFSAWLLKHSRQKTCWLIGVGLMLLSLLMGPNQ